MVFEFKCLGSWLLKGQRLTSWMYLVISARVVIAASHFMNMDVRWEATTYLFVDSFCEGRNICHNGLSTATQISVLRLKCLYCKVSVYIKTRKSNWCRFRRPGIMIWNFFPAPSRLELVFDIILWWTKGWVPESMWVLEFCSCFLMHVHNHIKDHCVVSKCLLLPFFIWLDFLAKNVFAFLPIYLSCLLIWTCLCSRWSLCSKHQAPWLCLGC